jgi:signal transduction histidine kinase
MRSTAPVDHEPGIGGLWLGSRTVVRLLLLAAAAGTTFLAASNPAASMAVWSPPLATAVYTVAAIVGLTLFQLGALRFRAFGQPFDLLLGIGFGALALANMFSGFLAATSLVPIELTDTGSLLMLIDHALAYLIFAAAVIQPSYVVVTGYRVRTAALMSCGVLLLFALASASVLRLRESLPEWLAPHTMDLVRHGAIMSSLLQDEAGWIIAANIGLAALLALTTYRLMLLGHRLVDAYLDVLVLGMSLLALAQLQAVLFPSGLPGYVSTVDVLRVLAYLALLIGLTYRITIDMATSASAEERLRLSRELHDGLVQQLTTLNIRLSQALHNSAQSTERLNASLQISLRLTQEALLEARHAITSLRSGTVEWEDFVVAVEAFCDEAAQNQDVRITLRTQGSVPLLPAELQLEVLRILNETISNAVRHGCATQVEVDLVMQARPARLILTVRDNGLGFTPGGQSIGYGVGLRSLTERLTARGGSLRLDSGPAAGTAIRAELPLPDRRRWFV